MFSSQEMIPPGNETGYYHITIAGLPFKCSWQRLKDFVRYNRGGIPIEVDHAFVYPGHNGTDGWVRFRGRDEFCRAMNSLKGAGAAMDGRSLIIDGRNETQQIPNPGYAKSEEDNYRSRQSSCSSTMQQFNSSGSVTSQINESRSDLPPYLAQEVCSPNIFAPEWQFPTPNNCPQYTAVNASFSPRTYFQHESPYEVALPFGIQPFNSYSMGPPGVVSTESVLPRSPLFIPSQSAYGYSHPENMYPTYSMSPAPSREVWTQRNSDDLGSVVRIEARKVIITQLPETISEGKVRNLVVHAIFKSDPQQFADISSQIQQVEVVRCSDGKSKAHAFAIFETHELAKRAVGILHGYKYHGNALIARFAKEGAGPSRKDSLPTQSHESQSASSAHRKALATSSKDAINRSSSRSSDLKSSGSSHAPQATQDHGSRTVSSRSCGGKITERDHSSDPPRYRSLAPPVVNGSASSRSRNHGKDRKHRT